MLRRHRGELRAIRRVADIRDEHFASAWRGLLQPRGVDVDRENAHAVGDQPFRDGPANAARGAGYDCLSLGGGHRLPFSSLARRSYSCEGSSGVAFVTILKRYRAAQAVCWREAMQTV